jgi:hypothetical protein
MPSLHHPVVGALSRDGAAVELPRQPDGEVANIDHLLDLAESFGHDFARLKRHEPAEVILRSAQFLRENSHELSAPWRWDVAPSGKGVSRPPCDCAHLVRACGPDIRYAFARDRRRGQNSLACKSVLRHSKPG